MERVWEEWVVEVPVQGENVFVFHAVIGNLISRGSHVIRSDVLNVVR